MQWKKIAMFTLMALVALGDGLTSAQDKAANDSHREEEWLPWACSP